MNNDQNKDLPPLTTYEPDVVIEESRGRLQATGAAMKQTEGGQWVRLRDVQAALARHCAAPVAEAQPATHEGEARDAALGEPDMLWDAEDAENCYGDGPEDFANNYASNCMIDGDECDVEVLCAYRGSKRTMRIALAKNPYDEELSAPVSWSWVDAAMASQPADGGESGNA